MSRDNSTASIATPLEATIRAHAFDCWEFVELANHGTAVPGTAGRFELGAMLPYPQTMSARVLFLDKRNRLIAELSFGQHLRATLPNVANESKAAPTT